jgi:hypothetical protein
VHACIDHEQDISLHALHHGKQQLCKLPKMEVQSPPRLGQAVTILSWEVCDRVAHLAAMAAAILQLPAPDPCARKLKQQC